MIVDIRNIEVGYGPKLVFDKVSLSFEGGIAGLVGPNGAGKTTLIRTLLGFLPFRAGSVEVCGHHLPHEALAIRSKIGYMPEGDVLPGELTALEVVAQLGELSGLPRRHAIDRAHTVLRYAGLGELRYRTLDGYSTGMKQRVKLAQAIVHDPPLLLLDEPTDGLDPTGRLEMLELLHDLGRSKGVNMIVCTHLLDDVEALANEIILIHEGHIVSRQLPVSGLRRENLFLVRLHGDPVSFSEALLANGIRLFGAPEGATLRILLDSDAQTYKLFAIAQNTDCVILRLEPLVVRTADVVMGMLEEARNADL